MLICAAMLCGCQGMYIKEMVYPSQETTEPSKETSESETFFSYEIKVRNSKLAVHSGPSYHYEVTRYITNRGTYRIIAEEIERLGEGQATVWGKLEGEGWINLEDAAKEDKPEASEKPAVTEPEENTTEKPEETEADFQPYIFKIINPCLQIYSGPGYHYNGCGEIRNCGSYTIVEEAEQSFAGGRTVTWGRLKSGVGWICLDDAKLDPEGGPPYRCTECGIADDSISRYALCDSCYDKVNAKNGQCECCGTYFPVPSDALRCHYCYACEECGEYVHEYGYMGADSTLCQVCSYVQNPDCCTHCGVELNEENTAFEGFGKCIDCYYETLDPYYICDNCGADCSYRGVFDGLCEDCYESSRSQSLCWYCGAPCEPDDRHSLCEDCDPMFCDYCGDPLMDDHNCGG